MRLNIRSTSTNKKSPLQLPLLLACLLFGAINLTGCATNAHKAQAAQVDSQNIETDASADGTNELNADFVYRFLVAEVASQRGDLSTASSIFYELAKREQDPRLAERAAKLAAFGNIGSLTAPAVRLWSELDPDSSEAQQAMIEMLIATGKLEETKPYLAKLLQKEETRASGFLYLNSILSRSQDKAGVLALIQSLAKPYPKLPEAQFAIAQAAWSATNDDVALQALNKADALKPGWSVAALLKGQVLFNKSPQEALDFYRGFLAKHPDATEVRMNMAKLLVTQKQYDDAKKEFVLILKSAKDNPDVTAVVGLLSYQAGDYAEAETYFQQALNQNFKNVEQIYIYLAQTAEKLNHNEEAIEWYKKVQPGQHYLEAQLDYASLVASTQSVDKAINQLDELEGLSTEQQILVIQSQASLLVKAKRNQDAYDLLDKTVKNMPNTPELVYDYALAAERIQKLDVMESELRKLIAAKPDFAAAYNALGYSFADRNIKLDEAQTLIEKALSITPNDHYMLDSLGWVYYRKGNLDKAIEYLQQAYKVNPDPEIAAHLGEVLWQKGQHEEAKKIWQDALSANPDNQVLRDVSNKFKS
jgi:tetratricopeptide (TPR) repeat protein